jgi:hypothetical protein
MALTEALVKHAVMVVLGRSETPLYLEEIVKGVAGIVPKASHADVVDAVASAFKDALITTESGPALYKVL